jgi:hypothetical protein
MTMLFHIKRRIAGQHRSVLELFSLKGEMEEIRKISGQNCESCDFGSVCCGGPTLRLLVERGEWIAWRDGLHARRNDLTRLPTFSDCGIQHPKGVEGFDPITMKASAAIRFALPGEWLLIKGESTKNALPSDQFPVLATRLVYGHLRGSFSGPTHCRGCELMKNAADGAQNLGSPAVWRKLGTIHHMTTVMDGLAALPWI